MRLLAPAFAIALVPIQFHTVPARAEPAEMVTSPRAILCLSPDRLAAAHRPAAAASQERLRKLRCLRSEPGVPVTVLDEGAERGAWKVRFRPEGISGGVTLWGLASSFERPGATGSALDVPPAWVPPYLAPANAAPAWHGAPPAGWGNADALTAEWR